MFLGNFEFTVIFTDFLPEAEEKRINAISNGLIQCLIYQGWKILFFEQLEKFHIPQTTIFTP